MVCFVNMPALELEGKNLGEKHLHYNKLLKDAITSNKMEVGLEECDISTLLSIDIASNNKNVEYILEVLKSENMLHVSRAIRKSTWLITDNQYAHIINPEYLYSQLFPQMTSKAICKLLLHIRLNLKDEPRTEQFFKYYEKQNLQSALKWLPYCSLPFTEKIIQNNKKHIKTPLLKRLCEKSFSILEIYAKDNKDDYDVKRILKRTIFFLNTHLNEYLRIVESLKYHMPDFGVKATKLIMQQSPHAIINNFEKYAQNIDIKTFAKYLKKENIKDFLLPHLKKENSNLRYWFNFNNMQPFIKLLPKKEQFEFATYILLLIKRRKETEPDCWLKEAEKCELSRLYYAITNLNMSDECLWYQFAPFDIAFSELKKLVLKESSPYYKKEMLKTMINCAGQNSKHIQTVLQYYRDKQSNDQYENKCDFVYHVIKQTNIQKYDESTWNILDDIFKNMDIYIKPGDNVGECIESIVTYKILHNEHIPTMIEKNFNFSTLTEYQNKLNSDEKEKIFTYLYNYLVLKMENQNMTNETELQILIETMEKILNLLIDWNKELIDYPLLLNKIRNVISFKKANSWNVNLSSFYNIKKSWRRYMFEESLILYPSEEACMNALKHDPTIFKRYSSELETIICKNIVSMQMFHKLRTYWPQTLTNEWIALYNGKLNTTSEHKTVIRGLCALLPQQKLLDMLKQYAPKEAKINWAEADELTIGLQWHFAKNMHFARPQPPPDFVLYYAKGEYLKYALPSLHAIFYNLSYIRSRKYIPNLLDSPVSFQKHIIRIAFYKLQPEELKLLFSNVWKSSKNVTIRAVIYKLTYDLLCRENKPDRVKELWDLLEIFIDNLSFKEDRIIYDLLSEIEKVPISVRANYLMKSYAFLKSLYPKIGKEYKDYEKSVNKLEQYCRNIMEFLEPDFVTGILLEYIDKKYIYIKEKRGSYESDNMISVMTSYVLCTKDEETQLKRYEQIIVPVLERYMILWEERQEKDGYVNLNLHKLLDRFCIDLKEYVIKENKIIPVKMFLDIQSKLEKSLPVPENYLLFSRWKLTLALAEILEKIKQTKSCVEKESKNVDSQSNSGSEVWNKMCMEAAPEFGKKCLEFMKRDIKLYFPCIYVIFSRALNDVFNYLMTDEVKWEICKFIILDNNIVEAYLAIIKILPGDTCYDCHESKILREVVASHPSVEVKMHYNHKFKKMQ